MAGLSYPRAGEKGCEDGDNCEVVQGWIFEIGDASNAESAVLHFDQAIDRLDDDHWGPITDATQLGFSLILERA